MDIPEALSKRLVGQYGKEGYEKILRGYCAKRVTSFRANTLLSSAEEVSSALKEANISFSRLTFPPDAFAAERGEYSKIAALPIYERGEIYFQSLSSMLPPLLLEPRAGERILDMTAAPGGKTCQLSALSKGLALITACEKDKTRFARLSFNVTRQGAKNVTLLNEDACFLSDYFRFDKILLDAPCSGSGTISAGDKKIFDEKLLSRCVKVQKRLLQKAFSLLKKGGEIVYSTCSLLKEENEEQILKLKSFGKAELLPISLPAVPALSEGEGMLTVLPDENFEGFFLAKLKKV